MVPDGKRRCKPSLSTRRAERSVTPRPHLRWITERPPSRPRRITAVSAPTKRRRASTRVRGPSEAEGPTPWSPAGPWTIAHVPGNPLHGSSRDRTRDTPRWRPSSRRLPVRVPDIHGTAVGHMAIAGASAVRHRRAEPSLRACLRRSAPVQHDHHRPEIVTGVAALCARDPRTRHDAIEKQRVVAAQLVPEQARQAAERHGRVADHEQRGVCIARTATTARPPPRTRCARRCAPVRSNAAIRMIVQSVPARAMTRGAAPRRVTADARGSLPGASHATHAAHESR